MCVYTNKYIYIYVYICKYTYIQVKEEEGEAQIDIKKAVAEEEGISVILQAMRTHTSNPGIQVCCSVLQCVTACFRMLQCVAVWCSVVQCGAVAEEVWISVILPAMRTLFSNLGIQVC